MYLSVCLSIYVSICLSVCLSVCLSICLSVYVWCRLAVCVSVYVWCWLTMCVCLCVNRFEVRWPLEAHLWLFLRPDVCCDILEKCRSVSVNMTSIRQSHWHDSLWHRSGCSQVRHPLLYLFNCINLSFSPSCIRSSFPVNR